MAKKDARYDPINRAKRENKLDQIHPATHTEEKTAVYQAFVKNCEKLAKKVDDGVSDEELKHLRRIIGETAWDLRRKGVNMRKFSLAKLGCKYISPGMCKNLSSGRK